MAVSISLVGDYAPAGAASQPQKPIKADQEISSSPTQDELTFLGYQDNSAPSSFSQNISSAHNLPQAAGIGELRPLSQTLNPDGSLNLAPGWSGSLDPTGFHMALGPSGEPHFLPTAAVSGGDWDPRFGLPGVNGSVMAIAVNGSNVYVGGTFETVAGATILQDGLVVNHIARWDGQRWHTLGAGVDDDVRAIAISGSNVYVGGDFHKAGSVNAFGLARWNGSNWAAVGNGTGDLIPGVNAIAINGSTVYVAGDFDSFAGVTAANIARWNGTAWSALDAGITHSGNSGTAEVDALALSNGQLYVGGDFDRAGTVDTDSIARWDGSTWAALGQGLADGDSFLGTPEVYALAAQGNILYVGGNFKTAGGQPANRIARWNGSSWQALGAGLDAPAYAVEVIGSNVYVGGYFDQAGTVAASRLARWNGSSWSSLKGGVTNASATEIIQALAATSDGRLYVGGSYIDRIDQLYVNDIGMWDGVEWWALGQGVSYGSIRTALDAVAVDAQGNVFVGGISVDHAGGRPVNHIAQWDGQRWSDLKGGLNGTVDALLVNGNTLYVGGQFSLAGSVGVSNIARWNIVNQSWSSLGSGTNKRVRTLAYSNGILYVGGDFTAAGNTNAHYVAWWDGNVWHRFGQSAEIGDDEVRALAVQGNNVYIGGTFGYVEVGGVPVSANKIVQWNKATDKWFTLGNGLDGDVDALAIIGNELYVGGNFTQAGTINAKDIARWNLATNQWSSVGGPIGSSTCNGSIYCEEVNAFTVIGTDLYVGGIFTVAGSTVVNNIARWNTVSQSWSALGSGINVVADSPRYDSGILGLATNGVDIYVAGDFDPAGDHPASGLAHWGPPPPLQVSMSITPGGGGTLDTGDGFIIQFPPGAVSEEVFLTYQGLPGPTSSVGGGRKAIRSFTLEARTAGGTLVSSFTQPYTILLDYTHAELGAKGVKETGLNLLYRTGSNWTAMLPCAGCSVNTGSNRLTVKADHLTEFAFVGDIDSVFLPLVIK
ncbi:MAG: hypothetical protein KDJ52_25735 [Anaerolineae bacterium]|nr:hypothetical protein [Anaerolineae bacterium]